MARMLLIRHAVTEETGTKLTGRLPGVSLSDEGRASATRLAERLGSLELAAVFTSPLERTRETADIVAHPHGLRVVEEPSVIEVDYGAWQGRSLAQLRRLAMWRQIVSTPSQVVFPDGESMLAMQVRAVEACNRIAASAAKRTVAVVSHADVIKAILSHYLGQPFDLFQRLVIAPASVSVVALPKSGPPAVVAINSNGAG